MPDEFLLIPIPPTPNGRLHLGHIAGPYLRMDALARHLRSFGHTVTTASATDDFDSYVLWRALQEGRSPEQVCWDYNRQIKRDLAALDIELADFSNVVSGPQADVHRQGAQAAVARLIDQGSTVSIVEEVLYSPSSSRYIAGVWLVGHCPRCSSSAAGYFCEACGAHFKPEAMSQPRDRLGESPIERRQVESLFLRVSDVERLIEHISVLGAPTTFIDVVRRHVTAEGPLFRLTAPGIWGVGWTPDRFGNPRVLFEGGWEYALSCGDRYAKTIGKGHNPFTTASRVKTVVSFGIDNAVLLLFGTMAILSELPDGRSFDRFLTNYFLNLEGSKFSTSRRHVIWSGDIVDNTGATSDAVRYFLARKTPEQHTTNFDINEFVECVNNHLVMRLQPMVLTALQSVEGVPPLPASADAREHIEATVRQQQAAFDPVNTSLTQAVDIIEGWIELRRGTATRLLDEYRWLQGLAFLAAPIMPQFSGQLWSALGLDGLPTTEGLHRSGLPRLWQGQLPFGPVSRRSLAPCLPESLAAAAE